MLDFLQSFRGKAAATVGSAEVNGDPTRTFDAILRAAATEGASDVHFEPKEDGLVVRFRLDGRLQPDGSRYKVPQMGWNRVFQQPHPMWRGVDDGAWFYFVHSFHAAPSDPRHTAGHTDYGGRFTSAVARDNIFATQFHPEKSAAHGLALYRNFLHWTP